ncbi:MAG: hypothetical protein JST92_17095 [Deltaproteobacteria bacterium]|nr:hypothetical protein [Deltaproteobacteria bacterium]
MTSKPFVGLGRWALLCAAVSLALLSGCTKTQPVPGGLGDSCLTNTDCATGFLCASGKCILPSNLGGCEPGRFRCNGADIEKCADTGLGWERQQTCATGCSGGECNPQVCAPNTRRCEGDIAESCSADGAAWLVVQSCPSHCDPDTGNCKQPICTPFSTTCSADNKSVLVCDAYGAQELTQACGAQSICDSGRCRPDICTGGEARCTGDAAEQCVPDGSSWALVQLCATGCDPDTGACRPQVCTPFSTVCAATQKLTTCNANGTVATTASCPAQTKCANGRCNPYICTPGARQCSGDALQECVPDGSSWSLLQVCATGCNPSATPAACKPQICTPFSATCANDNSTLLTCDSTGTVQTGTSCGANAKCTGGRCVPSICSPDTAVCANNVVQQCTPAGDAWSFVQVCATGCDAAGTRCADQTCTPFATTCSTDKLSVLTCNSTGTSQSAASCGAQSICNNGRCVPDICTPGALRCEGDAAEQCAPDGGSWALVEVCPAHCDNNTGKCKAQVCTPFASRCDPSATPDLTKLFTCDAYGASEAVTSCGSGNLCSNGRCQTVVCTPGATRCSAANNSIETCDALGLNWNGSSSCSFGCAQTGTQGNTTASCKVAACNVGDTRCAPNSPSALQQCLPDQTGFGFVTFCATGCEQTSSTAADCKAPVCSPFARRCNAAGTGTESCAPDGSGYTPLDTCAQGCASGVCVTNTAGCDVGDLRCNGNDAQLCNGTGTPGVTVWNTTSTCVAGCSSGACLPGGSCVPFALHAAVAAPPADGVSSILFYSDPIVGADGVSLPDGLLFNVSIPTGTPRTADASSDLPGLQVRTHGGLLHFSVTAPSLSGGASTTTSITASLAQGPTCAGAASVKFDSALNFVPGVSGKLYVAEDFSTTAARNLGATTADWNTSTTALIANWPGNAGDGRDGDLKIDATTGPGVCPTPCDLSASGYAPTFAVLGVDTQSVTVDGVAGGLSGGDEVILWDTQGSAAGFANAGSYEFLTVAQATGSSVTFTTPIAGNYGAAADQAVQTQKVQLQRVPHFGNLTVAAGSKLTTAAWDGTKGGLLFVRVAGTSTISGGIDMTARGFRGGPITGSASSGEDQTGAAGQTNALSGGAGQATTGQGSGASYGSVGTAGTAPAGNTYGLPLLGRIHLGAGGGGSASAVGGTGGGAIVIFANAIAISGTGTFVNASASASAGASAGGGAGGSVWLSAPTVTIGSANGVQARGSAAGSGRAGGNGRIRVDSLSALDVACTGVTPNCAQGINGPLVAQSTDELTVGSTSLFNKAFLLQVLGTGASAPSFFAAAKDVEPPDFGPFVAGSPPSVTFVSTSGSPGNGPRFRWKATLKPAPGAPVTLQGLQFQLNAQ